MSLLTGLLVGFGFGVGVSVSIVLILLLDELIDPFALDDEDIIDDLEFVKVEQEEDTKED